MLALSRGQLWMKRSDQPRVGHHGGHVLLKSMAFCIGDFLFCMVAVKG